MTKKREQIERLYELFAVGETIRNIHANTGISFATIIKYKNQWKKELQAKQQEIMQQRSGQQPTGQQLLPNLPADITPNLPTPQTLGDKVTKLIEVSIDRSLAILQDPQNNDMRVVASAATLLKLFTNTTQQEGI